MIYSTNFRTLTEEDSRTGFLIKFNWLIRPGSASTLIPNSIGTVHEWIISTCLFLYTEDRQCLNSITFLKYDIYNNKIEERNIFYFTRDKKKEIENSFSVEREKEKEVSRH